MESEISPVNSFHIADKHVIGLKLPGMGPLEWSFMSRYVRPNVIQSGISALVRQFIS